MPLQNKRQFTIEEYLAIERNSEQKCEYFAGEIYAMVGASEPHNLIVTNLVRELSNQLKKRSCKVYSNDMRVKVKATGSYTYPDVVAICKDPIFDDEHKDTLLNPTVLIEILSKSTEAYGRGEKFEHYRKMESLSEYLLVSQDKYYIEHFTRQPSGQWLLSETNHPEQIVELPSIHCQLAMSEVYDKVEI